MSSLMETITNETPTQSMGSQTSKSSFIGQTTNYRLKRSGARPLIFQGTELAMAMSFTPSLPYWYEINIYRTTDQRFVLAIRLFYQSADEQDTVQAWSFDSLEQTLNYVENYDAGQDVKISVDCSDQSLTPIELAAHAMQLRSATLSARRHYQSLVGEFFYDLETQQ